MLFFEKPTKLGCFQFDIVFKISIKITVLCQTINDHFVLYYFCKTKIYYFIIVGQIEKTKSLNA